MTVTLKIKTDNAAFEENPNAEVARILEDAARTLRQYGAFNVNVVGGDHLSLFDRNGNKVGAMTVEA